MAVRELTGTEAKRVRDIEYRLTCAARILFAAKSVPAGYGTQLSENGRERGLACASRRPIR